MKLSGPTGKSGWTYEGNTLTTVIPVPSQSSSTKAIVEIHRATTRRDELDAFPGAITRLRATYDSLIALWPLASPPDILIDAMQSGDRLGYHPERAQQELAHFNKTLPQAQAAVAQLGKSGKERLQKFAERRDHNDSKPADLAAQRQRRLDALERAQKQVAEAGK
jgi:alpha-glucosidase